jgi:ABC-type nitrate/sulfonate/bicarbonate transport system substrate-binding protein
MRRQLTVVAGAAALLLAVTACSSGTGGNAAKPSESSSAPKTLTKVTAQVQGFLGYDSFWVALDQGFFKDEGLDVDAVQSTSGTTALQAFNAGSGDVITVGDLPSLTAWFNMKESTPVIAALQGDGFTYQAASQKDITSAKQLIGKTVATRVGSTGSYFLDSYLLKNGVQPDQVKTINLDPPQMTAALCKGEIAAYFWAMPYPDQTVAACGNSARVLTSGDGYMVGYGLLMARGSWLKEHPDLATAFLKALRKGADFAKKNPDKVADLFNKEFGVTPDSSLDQLTKQTRLVSLDQDFYSNICAEYNWAQDSGILKADQKLDLSQYAARGPLEKIDPKLAPAPEPCVSSSTK